MNATIRSQQQQDAEVVRKILLAAFPTHLEADLVDRLDQDGDSVIRLVAEQAGRLVGYVMLSRIEATGDGRCFRALGLGPVAVLPASQRSGIGSDLIREALEQARVTDEELVFVLGEPAYYQRFGFSAATAAPFESPYAGPYFMAQALADTALPRSGRAAYASAFSAFE